MKAKFGGTYEELKDAVMRQGVDGAWRICADAKHRQFCASNGAILNYWPSTQYILIDVDRSVADQELSNVLSPILCPKGNTVDGLFK